MKKLEVFEITEDVSNQETIAEVVKVLLLHRLSFSNVLRGTQLEIKEFDNCRESGYMYRVIGAEQDITFSVYEHRNSDEIIINGCLTENVQSYGAYNGDSKWDYLNSFSYDQHYKTADQLSKHLELCFIGKFDTTLLK